MQVRVRHTEQMNDEVSLLNQHALEAGLSLAGLVGQALDPHLALCPFPGAVTVTCIH